MNLIVGHDQTGRRRTTTSAIPRVCAAAVGFVPIAASAHVAVGGSEGFVHGFSHPLGGIDHVLAMVAVGLFAARLRGRALWLLSLTFVCMMAPAGIAGMHGVRLPFAEIAIGLSVVVFGVAVALQLELRTPVATSVVGFFAVFHGHAHGAEMPASISAISYGIGFVCATALLHATGVSLGVAMGKTGQRWSRRVLQCSGAAMAIAGVTILIPA